VAESEPLYRYIEFCRDPETLWHKLQSGLWDWLGRKPDGQFVLGRPKRKRAMFSASPSVFRSTAAEEGKHGININGWNGLPKAPPSHEWFESAAQARAGFEERVADLDRPEQAPILARVVLIEDGYPTDERFIAQTPPPNYQ
jgi:hypothetical protein